MNSPDRQPLDVTDEIAAILYCDRNLDAAIAYVLVRIIKAAYRDLTSE
ncbi:hypothetical protein [Calothrix sp. NIES-2098]